MIIDSGLGPSGPDDEQIQKSFQNLRWDILQFVKRYCTNHSASINDKGYTRLDDGGKDFWIMAVIANTLHKNCFDDEKTYFGFNEETDTTLTLFYNLLNNEKSRKSIEPIRMSMPRPMLIN